MRLVAYIGSCRAKDCAHTTRGDRYTGDCPDHGRYPLQPLYGEVSMTRACDARCMGARGPSCSCSCGGANHGAGFVAGAYAPITPETTLALF